MLTTNEHIRRHQKLPLHLLTGILLLLFAGNMRAGATTTINGSAPVGATVTGKGGGVTYSTVVGSGGTYTVYLPDPPKAGVTEDFTVEAKLDCHTVYAGTAPSTDLTWKVSTSATGQTFNSVNFYDGGLTYYVLSGIVTQMDGSALSGVTITTARNGSAYTSSTTDANGRFSQSLPCGDSYTVTPTKTGYTFSPSNASVTAISRDTAVAFVARPNQVTISGVVATAIESVSNVRVNLSGSATESTYTNSQGKYSFAVDGDGVKDYTVTVNTTDNPCFSSFTPSTTTFSNITTDQVNDITAVAKTVSITGNVKVGGVNKSGVTIKLSSGTNETAVTDGSGNYSFTGLECGKNYTLTPSLADFSFTPQIVTLESITSNQTQNFTGVRDTFALEGYVTEDGVALQGVSVSVIGTGGTATANTNPTDSNGYYKFTVEGGGTYQVKPTKDGYEFTPSSGVAQEVSRDTAVNFSAKKLQVTISGQVKDLVTNSPVAGILVQLSGSASEVVLTNSQGLYSFSVFGGSTKNYTITPATANSCFSLYSPVSKTFNAVILDQTQDFTATRKTVTISGNVKVDGSNQAGVTIKLSGGTNSTTVTDGSGNYTFSSLECGNTYVLTPSYSNVTFSPAVATLSDLTATTTTQNFTGTRDIYIIEGYVTQAGVGLSGVTVSATGTGGGITTTNPATTGGNGYYSFTVQGGGTYQLTPTKAGFEFTPANAVVSNISKNTAVNFAAKANKVTISGQVTDGTAPVPSVLLTLSGSDAQVVLTNSQGQYSFTVDSDGVKDYTVTPSQDCFLSFTPASKTFSDIASDSTQDFTGIRNALTISGTVKVGGVGKSGVTVKLTGGTSLSAVTDPSGNYVFGGLDCGKTYSLTPSLAFFTFTPSVSTFPSLTTDKVQNFTGVQTAYKLEGYVTSGGIGLQGVNVSVIGGPVSGASSTSTDTDGHYAFTVYGGETYSITPTKDGYTFSPAMGVTQEISRDTAVNFTATKLQVKIEGMVNDGAAPVGNVKVDITLNGSPLDAAYTNSQGQYSFTVEGGSGKTYVLTPSHDCLAPFTPSSKTISNPTTNVSQDFTGTRKTVNIIGNVKVDGANKSGVTVKLSGGTTANTTTDGSGNYAFTGLECGKTYTVTPALGFTTFAPPFVTLTDVIANQTQDFTGVTDKFTLEGFATSNGTGLSGVSVKLTGGNLPGSSTATTDGSGHFTFSVYSGESYTVTPTLDGYTFSPQATLVQQVSRDTTVNFTAQRSQVVISGLVTDGSAPVGNIQMTLSGSTADTVFANSAGQYSFKVDAGTGKTYTVTPSQSCFGTFTPSSQTFSNLTADASQDFVGTRKSVAITGNVKVDGANKSGVTISISGGITAKKETDGLGNYAFTGLDCSKTYVVTPSLQSHTFAPSVVTLANVTVDTVQNFTGSRDRFTLEGFVTSGGQGVLGVSVGLTGGLLPITTTNPATTDANGHYAFSVLSGETYTVTPTKDGYTFTPPSATAQGVARDTTVNFNAVQTQATISGLVTDGATPASNIKVTLSGSTSDVVFTNAAGQYSFKVEAGTGKNYTVTPSDGCFTAFSPASKTFTDLQADASQDFAGTSKTVAVSGNVKVDGANRAGVLINLSGGTTAKVETDASGNYAFAGLACGKTYLLTPTLANHTFTPPIVTLADVTADATQNFAGTRDTFTIDGFVTFEGKGLDGVGVKLTGGVLPGATTNPVTTDATGRYSFEVYGGESYTVTPTKDGFNMTPPSSLVQEVSRDTAINFIAQKSQVTITGLVTDGVSPVSNVEVALSGSASDVVFTNTAGQYSFRVEAGTGKNYTVTPSDGCFTAFSPASKTFTDLQADASQDFAGTSKTVAVSGNVKVDGANSAGVLISLSGGTTAKIETDASGNYSFTGLACGKTYLLTPTLANYTFTPPIVTLAGVTANATQDFSGSHDQFLIDGFITIGGAPVEGASVKLSGGVVPGTTTNPTATDAKGYYSFKVLSGENYTITPTKDGLNINPQSALIQQIARDTTVNFTASQTQVTISGQVTDGATPIANVRMTLSGSSSEVTVTNSVGRYSFTVEAGTGKTYTVTPFLGCNKFQPSDRTYADPQSSVDTADFVTVPDGSPPVVGILSPTDGDKRPVPAGNKTQVCWTYTEQCPQAAEIWIERWDLSHQNLLFQTKLLSLTAASLPSGTQSRCDRVVIPCGDSVQPYSFRVDVYDSSGKKASARVFDAVEVQPASHCINGTIRNEAGCPIVGLSVKISTQTVKTDADGFYEVCNVPDGSYTVTPQVKGVSPSNYAITLACATGETGVGLDFVAPDALPATVSITSPTQATPEFAKPGDSFNVAWSYTECDPGKADIILQSKGSVAKPGQQLTILSISRKDLLGGTDNHTRTDMVTVPANVGEGAYNLVIAVTDLSGNIGQDTETVAVIVQKAPTVSAITPNTGLNTGLVQITNLAGTGFHNGAVVKLAKTGESDIPAGNVTIASANKITCSFDITSKALGQWDVVVTNTDGESGTLTNGFTINRPPAPSVNQISPVSAFNSGPVDVGIAGTNFNAGTTVRLMKAGESDIYASNVTIKSATQITCRLDITGVPAGQWNVVVINPDGQMGELTNGFTVVDAGSIVHDLVLTAFAASPNPVGRGKQTKFTYTIVNQGTLPETGVLFLMTQNGQPVGPKQSVGTIAAGATFNGTVKLTIPKSVQPGDYFIIGEIVAVPGETNTDNNKQTVKLTIQ